MSIGWLDPDADGTILIVTEDGVTQSVMPKLSREDVAAFLGDTATEVDHTFEAYFDPLPPDSPAP